MDAPAGASGRVSGAKPRPPAGATRKLGAARRFLATTRQAHACKAERQSQAPAQACQRACSALTLRLSVGEGTKARAHAALELTKSGQLPFLGSSLYGGIRCEVRVLRGALYMDPDGTFGEEHQPRDISSASRLHHRLKLDTLTPYGRKTPQPPGHWQQTPELQEDCGVQPAKCRDFLQSRSTTSTESNAIKNLCHLHESC